MATRGDIKDAIYNEMVSVAGTYDVVDEGGTVIDTVTLDKAQIGLRNPEQSETHPQIVYHDDYRSVTYNGVGSGPDEVIMNDDGTVNKIIWKEYRQAQFIIDVRATNETYKEPIYEALHSTFQKYNYPQWNVKNVNTDITDIDVTDATSVDSGDVEDVIRGDQLEIRVTYHRNYEFSTDNIQSVDTLLDADNDGTTDSTFTTT